MNSLPILLAAISGDSLVSVIVWLIVCGLIFWIVQWGLNQLPIAEPFKTVIRVIMIVVVVIVVINALLTLTGHNFIKW